MSNPEATRIESMLANTGFENIRELVVTAIPFDRYVYCGEVSRNIKDKLGFYVTPDKVRHIAFTDKRVKRMWTENGWKLTRIKNLSDYL